MEKSTRNSSTTKAARRGLTGPRAFSRLPLNALRVFEAIARTGSMARAAELLNVQPSAVSMQLKLLQAHAGRPLFRKEGRGIALTPDGATLAAEIGAGLGQIESALRVLRIAARSEPIVLSVLPNFLNAWLLPRLARLDAELPDLDLRLHSSSDPVALGAGGADAAVRLGPGRWTGTRAEKLAEEWIVPVCTPAELARAGTIEHGAWPHRHRLIHNSVDPWTLWADQEPPGLVKRLMLDDALAALLAAESGQGLALVRASVAAERLARGAVVEAGPRLPYRYAFYFVTPRQVVRPEVATPLDALKRWLRRAMRRNG